MKRLLLITMVLVLLCFILPIIFTNRNKTKETINENMEKENINKYNYGEYNKIKLLHKETEEIEDVDIDEYLYGVVASEMPASFEIEALKAQAIVARTYTLYKTTNEKKHKNANICDDARCCQAWISKEERFNKWNEEEQENNWSKIVNAVNDTKGKIVTYEGKTINAVFHANSGGLTETANEVWGGTNYPYLQPVSTTRRRKLYSIQIRIGTFKTRFHCKN